MTLSLRTTSYTTAVVVAVILSILLLLGSQQYRSYKNYEKIIDQNEKIIFQFATIREHITESLLENRHGQLSAITQEVEELNSNISKILQEPLIPDEYRLSFVGQTDLAGIILLLRSIGAGDSSTTKIRQLSQEIRILGERLMLFDRVIVNHVKRRLVGFQSVVIGILAIMVLIVISALLFWHRKIAVPLFNLAGQTKQAILGQRAEITSPVQAGELADLAASFQSLLQNRDRTAAKFARHNRLQATINKVGQAVSQATSRDAVFTETCRAILANDDYCLAWIGIPAPDGGLLPVVADASTTMSRQECEECMAALLAGAEEKGWQTSPPMTAIKKATHVVNHDALAGLPKGPFKNTPLAQGPVSSISLPLTYNNEPYGVLTVYSTLANSFTKEEVEQLNTMGNELVMTIHSRETGRRLTRAESFNQQLSKTYGVLQAAIANNGDIQVLSPETEEITGRTVGRKWLSLLPPDTQEQHETTIKALFSGSHPGEDQGEMRLLNQQGRERTIKYSYSLSQGQRDNDNLVLWTGIDITEPLWVNRKMALLQAAWQDIFTDSRDLIFILDRTGTVLEINHQAAGAIGRQRQELIGQNVNQLLSKPETPLSPLSEALAAGSGEFELSGAAIKGEYRARIFSGPKGGSAPPAYLIMTARDIATRKTHRAETIKAAKLAAIGELAVGVAHEINNQSNVLINYAQILADEIDKAGDKVSPHLEILKNILNEGELIADITQQLLSFNTDRSELKEPVQAKIVVEDSLALVKQQLKHDAIQVKIELPDTLPMIKINSQKLQHVFLNLLSNARYALNSRYTGQDANKILEISGEVFNKQEKQWLRLNFTDRGPGIQPDTINKLFTPFFTTKPAGQGTGLGLCISRELLRDNGGELLVKSVPGDHTKIMVELPL